MCGTQILERRSLWHLTLLHRRVKFDWFQQFGNRQVNRGSGNSNTSSLPQYQDYHSTGTTLYPFTLLSQLLFNNSIKVIGFDWLQLSALMPGSLASADSDISSHVSLCSSACSALQVQKKVPSSSGSVSDDSPCDSFWCRNSPSPWGALAASDAASLDPADWNQFRSSSTHPVLTSGLSNCILLFLFYLTVL